MPVNDNKPVIRWIEHKSDVQLDVYRKANLVFLGLETFIVEYEEWQWDPNSCKCGCDTTSSWWWLFCKTKKKYLRKFRETVRHGKNIKILSAALPEA